MKKKYKVFENEQSIDGMLKHIYKMIKIADKQTFEDITIPNDMDIVKDELLEKTEFDMTPYEYATVYLIEKGPKQNAKFPCLSKYKNNECSRTNIFYDGTNSYLCVTTNYKVILNNNWSDDLKYQVNEPCEFHDKRFTVVEMEDDGKIIEVYNTFENNYKEN